MLVYSCVFFTNLWVERLFVILEGPVLLVLLNSISLVPSFFLQYFLIYFFLLYCQTCLLLSSFGLFLSQYSLVVAVYLSFSPHFPSRFCVSVRVPLGDTYFITDYFISFIDVVIFSSVAFWFLIYCLSARLGGSS